VRRLVPTSLPVDHRYDLGQRVTPPAGRAVRPAASGEEIAAALLMVVSPSAQSDSAYNAAAQTRVI